MLWSMLWISLFRYYRSAVVFLQGKDLDDSCIRWIDSDGKRDYCQGNASFF